MGGKFNAMRRVVITGIGSVTPLGLNFKETWEALKVGKSGLSECHRVSTDDLPWRIVGEVKGFDPVGVLSEKERNRLDLFIQYAYVASHEAIEDASLDLKKVAMIVIGSSRGGISRLEESLRRHLLDGRPVSPYTMPATTISMAPSFVAQRLGLKGYSLGISSACASGAVAIGETYRLIRDGYADAAITGGTEAPLCRLCLEGYGNAGALSRRADPTASRPFDSGRDGFVLSEGACMLVVEEMGHALRRGARVYAEIAGYAQVTGGEHQTLPAESGEIEAIRMALDSISMGDVGLINTHGTSTVQGDLIEARALRAVFGNSLENIYITADKSMTGHMLGASGATEVASTAMCLHEGVVTPVINVDDPDPDCSLKTVAELKRDDIETALSTSFGFGGVNAAILLRRFRER